MDVHRINLKDFGELCLRADFPLADAATEKLDLRFKANQKKLDLYEDWEEAIYMLAYIAAQMQTDIHSLLPLEVPREQRQQTETDR